MTHVSIEKKNPSPRRKAGSSAETKRQLPSTTNLPIVEAPPKRLTPETIKRNQEVKAREDKIEKEKVFMLTKPRKQRAGTSKAATKFKEVSQVASKKQLGVHTLSRYLNDVNNPSQKPFLDYSEAEMKSKIERLYRKTILPPEPVGRKNIEIDPDQKDKLDKERYLKQRDRISKRLKELEKTKPIKSEIEIKEVTSALLGTIDRSQTRA